MIELFNIIISLIIFFLFSFFPITHKYTNKLALSDGRSHFEIFFLNLLINFLFLFFLSFTEIKFLIYFYLVIFFSIILNLKFFVSKIFLNKIKNVIFLFFIFLNLIIYVSIVSDPTLSWDGQKNWFYKAQNFFYEYNFFDLNETKGVKYYPHFGSLLWGFFWKTSYLEYEYFGRLIFVYIFLTSIFALCQLIKKNSFLEFLTISILVLICFDGFLTKGYQELLVFSFLIFVSISIYKYILEKKKLDLLICFICLNMLPWIKNEGYIYVLIFNLSLIFTIKNFSNKNSLIFFIFFSLFFLLIKKIIFYEFLDINLTHGSNLEFTFELLVLKEFMTSMLIGLTVVFFKYKIWLLIFASIYILLCKTKISSQETKVISFFIINLFLYILTIFVIYYNFLNHEYGIDWWIDNSLDRILFQVSGFFALFLIMVIKYKKNYILK